MRGWRWGVYIAGDYHIEIVGELYDQFKGFEAARRRAVHPAEVAESQAYLDCLNDRILRAMEMAKDRGVKIKSLRSLGDMP